MPGEDKQIQDQQQFQTGFQNQNANTTSSNNQTGTTSSATGPWAPTQDVLQQVLGRYSGLDPSVTAGQSAAAGNLTAAASGIPNFGSTAAGGAARLFGTDTTPQVGMLTDALTRFQNNIGATASGAELDPYKTPGFADALDTAQNDITNRVKSVYAGSGRDPSGAGSFAKTLGRGLTEGIAPVIASQFNTNKANQMKAAGDLLAGAGSTAGAITGQGQVPLQNILQGIGALPGVTGAYTAPGAASLAAENAAYSQPFGNLSQLLAPLLQIGGAGTQTAGSTTGGTTSTSNAQSSGANTSLGIGHGETVQPQSMFSNILGGITGAAGLSSLLGGSGGIGSLASLLAISDKRAKTDIAKIGKLNDGQSVVRFRYKGDPKMQMGLLAQDVEKRNPRAVHEFGGLKMVNYETATDAAAAQEAA